MAAEKQATLRAGAAVLLSGLKDPLLRGARAYLLPTEVQPDPSWKADRVTVLLASPPEGRGSPFASVLPAALSICCAGCWTPQVAGRAFKSCSRCLGPRYCGPECQKRDWTARHKAECKRLSQVRETQDASVPPAGAGVKDQPDAHAFPWRITLETPAMQSPALPCFVTAHPNQRFVCDHAWTPQRAELPAMPILREYMSACANSMDATAAYFARVPFHYPFRTVLGVVGECKLTRLCVSRLTAHFDETHENRGSLFRWPPAACIWLDFADGQPIAPGNDTLLLVLQLIAGTMQRDKITGSGHGGVEIVTRVQPRLLKLSSLRRLCGDNPMTVNTTPTEMPFYPEFVRWASAPRGNVGGWTAAELFRQTIKQPGEDIMVVFEAVMREQLKDINDKLGLDRMAHPVAVI